MKIIIATPLYPPDIAAPAPYVKELVTRLRTSHEIVVVTYAHIPEKVEGVTILSVDKRKPRLLRLLNYTFSLWRAVRNTDILYIENGVSVELPAGLVSLFSSKPLIVHIGDIPAHQRALKRLLLKNIENFAFGRAKKIIDGVPKQRPEIFPFKETPKKEFDIYEKSWNDHIQLLEKLFKYVR